MRILFSSTPSLGHLLPLLPLATAARRAGHDVAVLTHESRADVVGDLPVLPAGPGSGVVYAEAVRRTGGADLAAVDVAPSALAELFAGARVDLGFAAASASAEEFGPDLIVCEVLDLVGPMIAASLGVPWVSHGITVAQTDAFTGAVEATVAPRYAERGLAPTARAAFVDPWPEALQPGGWVAPADRIAVRPRAYNLDGGGAPWDGAGFPGREDRPLALVTFGTVINDRVDLDAILGSMVSEDVNAIVTLGPGADPGAFGADRTRVHPVGFVPLGRLLEGADLVVSVGSAGTVLGALGRGLPMVLLPVMEGHTRIAGRVAARGAAAVVDAPERVGRAVGEVLAAPSYRRAAGGVAELIGGMNAPEEALRLLLDRVEESARA